MFASSRKRRASSMSVSSSSDHDEKEQLLYGRWYNVNRDCLQSGSNELRFNFAKVRRNDMVLIERCSFANCRCIGAGREKGIKFASIRTMTGFQGHIDTSCLDVKHVLEIHCPICHYQAVSEHEFFQHLVEHMEPLLKNMIGSNTYSLRCPMVKCNHEKNKCFRDKDELLDHMFDVKSDSGRNNFLKVFVMLCMQHGPPETNASTPQSDHQMFRQLKEDLEIHKREISKKSSELDELQVKHNELLEINSICDNKEKVQEKALYDKEKQIKDLEDEGMKSKKEIDKLNGQIQTYKDQRRQGKDLCNQIQQLNQELTLENDKNKSDVESLSKRLDQTLQQLEETLSQNSLLKTSLVETESKLKSAKMNQNQKQSCTECHELQKELEQKRHENVQVSLLRAQMMKMKEVTNQEVAKMQQILALRDKEISVLRQGSLACMKPEPK